MPAVTFDPTLNWGAILNASILVAGFIVAFTRIGGRIDLLSLRLKAVEDAIKCHSDNNTRISILEERVTNHGKMIATNQSVIEDLRRGTGFITKRRDSIDGEYPK